MYPSTSPPLSQVILTSVVLLSAGVESQRDQSGLLPGYDL